MLDLRDTSKVIGLTTTIPVEIIYAAGLIPIDLNNLFITGETPENLIKGAESIGFAHNICSWIKGIYSAVLMNGIEMVISVTGGDCSNSVALSEVLQEEGIRVIPFDYPLDRDKHYLKAQIEKLQRYFSVSKDNIRVAKLRLDKIRAKLTELDRLTFQENLVTGLENHIFLLSSSDFRSNPDTFEQELDALLKDASNRRPFEREIRLGYIGVPPIFHQFYETIETLGARVVFNEVQRQFSMPYGKEDIVDQYLAYTYPYSIHQRMQDIQLAISERDIDGLIHYTQTFCHRQIYDIIFRKKMGLPILTLEGDRPGELDARTIIRVETFIEMLKHQKFGEI